MTDLADFIEVKNGGAAIYLRRELARPALIRLLGDVDGLLTRPGCVIVKDQRKIKVGRVALQCDGVNLTVYIKRYNAFSWRSRIQSLFCRSGAVRSLRGAAILQGAQIATAPPVAAVEVHRWGMRESSFYVSEEIIAAKTADAYWRENLRSLPGAPGFRARRRFLIDLSRLFGRLHGARIYHNDLKDFNILVRAGANGKEELFVLDLEGMRGCRRLSARRRVKNLVQLNRTLGQFLTRAEKLHFLKAYLTDKRVSHAALAQWVVSILSASRKADRWSLAKGAISRKNAGG